MFDLSRFMQEFKHKFSMWFNKRHGRKGALWEERFKSVLVEGVGGDSADGLGGLLAVAAYIDLNPVRAGLVDDPKDYRWSSYGAAIAGDGAARDGLAACVGAGSSSWRHVGRRYRAMLFGVGGERIGGATVDGKREFRRGFTQRQIDAVIEQDGTLPLAVLLRCRLRFFTEGIALGSRAFLRDSLGAQSEAREMVGADWRGLLFAGKLRRRLVEAPG